MASHFGELLERAGIAVLNGEDAILATFNLLDTIPIRHLSQVAQRPGLCLIALGARAPLP